MLGPMTNPYDPPQTPVSDPEPQAGSPVKAVLLGLTVDIGGSLLASVALGIVYAVVLGSQGVEGEDLRQALEGVMQTGWGFAIGSAVGCAFSVLGGFVCARISRRRDYRLGWVQAGLSVAIGALLSAEGYSLLQQVLLGGVTVACVLIGVRTGMRTAAPR
jgi:MFS family permease